MVTRSAEISWRTEIGTEAPPMAARDLPSEFTVRLIRISASEVSAPRPCSLSKSSSLELSRRPSTRDCWVPVRTVDESALFPSSRPSAVRTIVFPAPVSPVRAVKPGPNSRFAELMTPMFLIPMEEIKPTPPDLASR